MLGLEISKYRIWYGGYQCPDKSECYITERSLFYEDLDKVVEDSERTLANYGQKFYEEKAFGYECYDLKNHIKLQLLRDSLLRHRMQIQWANLGVKPCLNDKNIQKTIEEAKKLINYSCCRTAKSTLIIDESSKEDWIEQNPYCVAREKWEALAYKVCGDLKFKVTSKEVACDLAYTLTSEEVDCSLQYAIESNKKDCKIDFTVSYEEWENSGCKTSYKDCEKLSSCGISFDHVISMQRCGIKTNYNYSDNCPEISYKNKVISLGEINIDTTFDSNNNCTLLEQIKL